MADSAFHVTDIAILFLCRRIIKDLAHLAIHFFISDSRRQLRSIHKSAALRKHINKGKDPARILVLYGYHINSKRSGSAVIRQVDQSDRV